MHLLQKHKLEAKATNESLILDCKESAYLMVDRWLSWALAVPRNGLNALLDPLSLSLSLSVAKGMSTWSCQTWTCRVLMNALVADLLWARTLGIGRGGMALSQLPVTFRGVLKAEGEEIRERRTMYDSSEAVFKYILFYNVLNCTLCMFNIGNNSSQRNPHILLSH